MSADAVRIAGGRRLFAGGCLAALLVFVLAYANSFGNAFHFDDDHVLVENVYVRSLGNLARFFGDATTFSSVPANCVYRPLVPATLAIDYRLGGLEPFFFHADQLLLMALLGALLVAWFWRVMDAAAPGRWNGWLSLFAAAWFCVHVVNTETMNLMHARSEIISAMGVVGGLLLWVARPGTRRTLLYLLPVAVGALAKSPAVLFAPLLLVWLWLARERGARDAGAGRRFGIVVAALPAFAAGILVFLFVDKVMGPPTQNYGGGDRWHYALTQSWVWLQYVRLLFVPVGLTADTDLELIADWRDPRVLAGALSIALLFPVFLWATRSRRRMPIAFGIAWFAIALLPTSSILPLAEPINEHRIFLPWIGLIPAVVWSARLACESWLARPGLVGPKRVAAIAASCCLVLVGHAWGTRERNRVWATEETLWSDVTRKSPHNARGWMNFGIALMRRRAYPEAKTCFERARELRPAYHAVYTNLAILAGATGDRQSAESSFGRALALGPAQPGTRYHFALWLVQQGRGPEAIPELEEAIRLSPAHGSARLCLMGLLAARGEAVAATAVAREYLALAGEHARARALVNGAPAVDVGDRSYASCFAAGLRLGQNLELVDSALAYRAALAVDARSADALNNLGWTLGQLGFEAEAMPLLEAALRERPDFTRARNNLEQLRTDPVAKSPLPAATADEQQRLMESGIAALYGREDPAAAEQCFREVIGKNSQHYGAHYQLAVTLGRLGRRVEAAPVWQRVLEMALSYRDDATAARARDELNDK